MDQTRWVMWGGGAYAPEVVPVAAAVYPEGGSLIKKLMAIGDSQGLIIEEPILQLLGIDQDTPLEVKTDGEALFIRAARESRRQRVRQATARLMTHQDETLWKLAK